MSGEDPRCAVPVVRRDFREVFASLVEALLQVRGSVGP